MKVVIQRVKNASVEVDGEVVGKIEKGFLVLLGIKVGDTKQQADYLVKKVCNLRVFTDENDKMNLSLKDVNGKLLIVSQFTLYGNCNDGNRPSFIEAARPEEAIPLYEYFCDECSKNGIEVQKGIFGADMKVNLLNDGPVTVIVEK
mgnify:CR=1 FL=1